MYVTYVPVSPVTAGENGRERPQGKRQKEKKRERKGKFPFLLLGRRRRRDVRADRRGIERSNTKRSHCV